MKEVKDTVNGWMAYCNNVKEALDVKLLAQVQCKYLMTQYTSGVHFTKAAEGIKRGDCNMAGKAGRNS